MDLSKVKQKLNSLENKGGKKVLWRPEIGKNLIRFVPNIHKKDFPFMELFFYYDFGNRTIISPKSFGEPDPIVEFANELYAANDEESYQLAREISPKVRTYAPILERGKEEEGVKFYGFGKTVFSELLKLIDDEDYGDITDPETGRDITIEYEKNEGDPYPRTTVRPKPKQTKVTESPYEMEITPKELVAKLKEMPTPKEIWEVPTYDELKNELEAFLANKDSDEVDEDVPQSPGNDEDEGDSEEKGTGLNPTDDPDEMFDNLFDE